MKNTVQQAVACELQKGLFLPVKGSLLFTICDTQKFKQTGFSSEVWTVFTERSGSLWNIFAFHKMHQTRINYTEDKGQGNISSNFYPLLSSNTVPRVRSAQKLLI